MAKTKSRENASLYPTWVGQHPMGDEYYKALIKIADFYVLHTPYKEESYQSKELKCYGWPDGVWKNRRLSSALLNITENPKAFVRIKTLPGIHEMLVATEMNGAFYDNKAEKASLYGTSNLMMSIFFHIRNALAHGRFSIYSVDNERFYAMEDGQKQGKKANAQFEVRARMVLKESTLLQWIDIIQGGPKALPPKEKAKKPKKTSKADAAK